MEEAAYTEASLHLITQADEQASPAWPCFMERSLAAPGAPHPPLTVSTLDLHLSKVQTALCVALCKGLIRSTQL